MPIKIQGDLPVKEILERENIFVMDEGRAVHPSNSDSDSESDAAERGDRTSAFAFSVKYTTAGGCNVYGG